MPSLQGKLAIVTGASRGIGHATAIALANRGADVVLAGRDSERLRAVEEALPRGAVSLELDLSNLDSIGAFVEKIRARVAKVDVLVNCAGIYSRGTWEQSSAPELENVFATNVRGVFALTRELLPLLVAAAGDVVFVNSSIVQFDGKGVGQFAATQHALKALADALRAEINDKSVRVLSIFPGRTATPRQRRIHEMEGKPYRPERLLQPEDVAQAIISSLELADTAEVTDLRIRPRYKG